MPGGSAITPVKGTHMTFSGFSQRWKDFPDYILGITEEIWENRGLRIEI